MNRLRDSVGIQLKPYLPGEFEAERIAEEAIDTELNSRIEDVSQRAVTEKQLGENIQQDLEKQIEFSKKETDALYDIAKEVEDTKKPNLKKTANKIVEQIQKLEAGDLTLKPEGYSKANTQLRQTLTDLGFGIEEDEAGRIVRAIKVKDIPLSQAVEVKRRLNNIINYDIGETSAQDLLKGPVSELRGDIRQGYGPKNSKARKAFEEAETKFGEFAEKKGKKSIRGMRSSEKPESVAKIIRTPSGLADLKDVVSKEQFAQIERELLEYMRGQNQEKAQAFYREVRPSLSSNTQSVAEQIIESKSPLTSPSRKVAQRQKIQEMVLDDVSKAVETGQRPDKALDLWKTKEGQQLIKHALEGNPNKSEVIKYLSDQSFSDFASSVVGTDGKINFTKLDKYLKDPATVENLRLIGGEEAVSFFKNLETLSGNISKNESILERTIAKGNAPEREKDKKRNR